MVEVRKRKLRTVMVKIDQRTKQIEKQIIRRVFEEIFVLKIWGDLSVVLIKYCVILAGNWQFVIFVS